MGQRLSDSAVQNLTNRGLERFTTPLGYKKDGSPFYLIGGASPDDDSNDDGGTGGTGGGEGGSGSEGQNDGGTGSDAGGNDSAKDKVDKAEYDALMERMKAADRNKSETERKLKELQDKDLSEQERLAKKLPELEQTVQQLSEENKGLKAKVAFLGLDGISWHDPDVALGQVDLSEVLKDDGTIDKGLLKKAAEKLAKDKSYLVKSAQDDGKGQQKDGGQGQGSSGSPVGGGSNNGNKNGLDEAALRKKYPALN